MKEFSLLGFIEHVAVMGLEVEHANHHALEEVGKLVTKEVYRVIGTYDYGWPELAPSTQDDRESHGFAPDEPLKRTGEMRDSVWYKVGHDEVTVGTDSQIAVWQELGTSRIPPRPFLQGAAQHKMPEALDIIGRATVAALSGEMVGGANSIVPKK
ncbi:hypothetical protein [Bradyrhizobium erythrophlei]|uniref:Phage protein, HK97 gp10 family n=1 Tax=Bradyrhizobium erythrophlei TaxID=1437360 RepID=A0A1M5NSF2_9BRAD|nr:hypothetical protein [Bradyrhizobium erythrophlei]SHG91883.1 hypothetical protein SAMN05443248_3083 [Bradyrhizobium erythrophlei]